MFLTPDKCAHRGTERKLVSVRFRHRRTRPEAAFAREAKARKHAGLSFAWKVRKHAGRGFAWKTGKRAIWGFAWKAGSHAYCGFAQETARAYSGQDPHVSGSTGAPASWPRPVGWYYNWNPLLSDGIMKRNALIHVHQEENIRWREKR